MAKDFKSKESDKDVSRNKERSNNRGKGNKSRKDFKPRKDQDVGNGFSSKTMNDPYWYVLNPELMKDAASLSYSHFLGKGFPIGIANSHAAEGVIIKLAYNYTFGVTTGSDDPANLAVRNLYTYVRHQNSGHTNYESADLGIYLFATASVIATLAHIERCIGVAKFYQRRSAIVPADLLKVLGVNNPVTFVGNLANYTLQLNTLWSRVSSLCIPKDFTFLKRWVWMNSQVFKDHESDKAALYVFKPVGVPYYDAIYLNGGCIRQPTQESATPTIDDWFNQAKYALDQILNDEDMNIMSGDILKAYGAENLLHFGMTPLDYVVEPVYVEEMLPQIQHAMSASAYETSNGYTNPGIRTGISYLAAQAINDQTDPVYTAAANPDEFTIYQVNGEIISQPVLVEKAGDTALIDTASGALAWASSGGDTTLLVQNTPRVLNSYKEVVPPEDNMLATRLMFVSERDTRTTVSSSNLIFITSCGSEVVASITLYARVDNNTVLYDFGLGSDIKMNVIGVRNATNLLACHEQFDWAPILYIMTPDAYGSNMKASRIMGDLDNFTLLSPSTLKGMHLTALLAEFSVTQYNLIKG